MRLLLPVTKSPLLRQSSIYDFRDCPRKYALRHRCNLMPKGFFFSRALEVGTFWHELMASLYREDSMDKGLERCHEEIEKDVAAASRTHQDPELVRHDYVSALALAQVMATLHWKYYPFDRDRWELIRLEQVVRNEFGEGIPDLVLRDRAGTGRDYWVPDHKSEGRDGLVRSAPLTFEMQPRFYKQLLEDELGVELTGCMHNIMVKCPLEFGLLDRPYEDYEHVLKSGPRKGQTETRRKYLSDVPVYDLYLARVQSWYEAEGKYILEGANREDHPVMIQSFVRFAPGVDEELNNEIGHMRTVAGLGYEDSQFDPIYEENWDTLWYPRRDNACRKYGKLCEFVPLCTSDPRTWPEKVEQNFKQRPEDERYATKTVEDAPRIGA